MTKSIDTTIDDAADTLRMRRIDFIDEAPTDPDATSIYDLTPAPPPRYVGTSRQVTRRRRMIRDTRENILRLREALAEGWDIGPELSHEEKKLAALEATPC
jgi:hypothetical protein